MLFAHLICILSYIASAGFTGGSVLFCAAFSEKPAVCYNGDQAPEM